MTQRKIVERRVRRALNTRAVYGLERALAGPSMRMDAVRRFARRVWREEKGSLQGFPAVAAGRGTPHCGRLVSYCKGGVRIVLARGERDRITTLHELAHALAPWWGEEDHGAAFQKRLARLIGRWM